MNSLKKNMSGIFVCLFEVIVGILLLIDPIGFTTGIITAAGIVLLVVGVLSIIKYFRTEVEEAHTGQYLMKGLLALFGGVFCVLKAGWVVVTFPVLTVIYGIVVLVTGLSKVQTAIDMLRRKNKKWFVGLIGALISLVCAGIILNNPFASTTVLWMFIGISLIVGSGLDLVTLIVNKLSAPKKEETT